jgi:FkbM family methyltransferase
MQKLSYNLFMIFIQYDLRDNDQSTFYVINNGETKTVTIVVCESNYNIPLTIINLTLETGIKYWFRSYDVNYLVRNPNFTGFRYLIIDNENSEKIELKTNVDSKKRLDICLPDIYILGDSFHPFYDSLYTNKLDYLFEKKYNGWFIDLGANLGAYTALAILHGNENCLMVEPTPILVQSLKETFKNFKNVLIQEGAITNKMTEHVYLNINGGANVCNHVIESDGTKVSNFRISELIKKYEIPEISLLKVDIEGEEYNVIFGIEDWVYDITNSISLETHLQHGDDSYMIEFLKQKKFNHRLISETNTHKEHFFYKKNPTIIK